LWSLPYELQMYALLPVIFLLTSKAQNPIRLTLIGWGLAACVAMAEYAVRSGSTEFLIARYFPCFMSGILAWRLMYARKRSLPGNAWIVFLLFIALMYRLVAVYRVYGPGGFSAGLHLKDRPSLFWPAYWDLISDWLFCLATGLVLPYCREIPYRFLKEASKLLAKYSYGVYLWHMPVIWLCVTKLPTGSRLLMFAASVTLTVVVSVATYHWIEHPGIEWSKRITSRRRELVPAASAGVA